MVREAEQHAAEDQKRKEAVEQHNQADTLAFQAEKTLRDLGDKVPADIRSDVETKIQAVREALKGNDTAEIRQSGEQLSEALQKIGAAMYQQPGGEQPGGGPQPGPEGGPRGEDDSTVEGEFREV